MISFLISLNVGGYFFGDYYNIISSSIDTFENFSGYWLRRVYFHVEKETDIYKAVLRFEMNDPGFRKSEKLIPYLKDAFISLKFLKGHNFIFGIQGSPAFDFIEKRWGFRHIQKTPQDLYTIASAREYGIGLEGKFTEYLKYHFTFGNGKGVSSENDKYKKYSLSLKFFPIKELAFEVYGDYDEANIKTIQGFLSYTHQMFDIGFTYTYQIKKDTDTIPLISSYITLKPIKQLDIVLRYDRALNPLTKDTTKPYLPETYLILKQNTTFNYFIVALNYKLLKELSISPTLDIVLYDDKNIKRELMFRLVVFYKFN
ncbi:MAG: hypothetical protein ABIL49_06710 [candidate division WOR-3 bacterium]|jgi:hypothetical protein